MQTVTTTAKEHAAPESAFALAIEVLRERVSGLSREDQDDLYELLPYLLGGDKEERESASAAVGEILGQKTGTVSRVKMDEAPSASLKKWMDHVGDRLREARKTAGLTQGQLAEESGIPQSYISRLERGEHSPTAITREKLERALKIPGSELGFSVE